MAPMARTLGLREVWYQAAGAAAMGLLLGPALVLAGALLLGVDLGLAPSPFWLPRTVAGMNFTRGAEAVRLTAGGGGLFLLWLALLRLRRFSAGEILWGPSALRAVLFAWIAVVLVWGL